MKPAKFRAITVMGGRWVFGDYLSQYTPAEGTKHYIVEHPYGRDRGREVMWQIKPETLGEYTGLPDRKGTAIYEGDIVTYKVGSIKCKGEVKWSTEGAQWIKGNTQALSTYQKSTEVIGHKYEEQ